MATPVSARETLLFVYYSDYAPFGWEENGKMHGIYIDIVNEVFANRLGIPVEHRGYPWVRAQLMVKDGDADGFCTVITPERLSYSHASKEPIIKVDFKLFTPGNNPKLDQLKKVKSISELQGFRLVDYLGSGWAQQNLAQADLDVYWLTTNDQIWQYLLVGRADATVKNEWTTRYILKKLGYDDRIIELPHPMNREPIAFNIFIGKKSPFSRYINQVDEAIKQLRKDGTLNKIYDKYK